MKKKTLILLLALVLVIGVVVAGSVAWLTDKTAPVTNVFTDSDINITLTETTGETYKMVPGASIAKDPKVTVLKGSEACWLFVEVTENLGSWDGSGKTFKEYLSYTVDSTIWTPVAGHPGVYYRQVAASADNQEFSVLKDNTITVSGANVTKEMMDAIDGLDVAQGATEVKPTLTFKAYAIQSANLTDSFGGTLDTDDIAAIWDMVKS